MNDLVSIIMPVYNAERFVAEAIRSVINQHYPYWELLVINDGSTDRSEAIIREMNDPRIRYFSQSNKGVSAARNRGLAEMKGAFFCLFDGDDVMPPHSLLSRLKVFERSDEITFADGAVQIYDADLSTVLDTWKPIFNGKPFKELVQLTARCFFGPTWMVKVMPGVRYQFETNVTHGEDLLFYMMITKDGGAYAFTDQVILYYRKNSGSAMTNLDGLAHGYTYLRKYIKANFRKKISFRTFVIHSLKTRKIMFLSFLSAGKFGKAFQYLLFGRI